MKLERTVYLIQERHSGLWCDSSRHLSFDSFDKAQIYTNGTNAARFAKDMREQYLRRPRIFLKCQAVENQPFEITVKPFKLSELM